MSPDTPLYAGLDLAGRTSKKKTCLVFLTPVGAHLWVRPEQGFPKARFKEMQCGLTDGEIWYLVQEKRPKILAIDAPLSLPREGGWRTGDLELRRFLRAWQPTASRWVMQPLSTLPMRILTERGITLAGMLYGVTEVIETHPRAALLFLLKGEDRPLIADYKGLRKPEGLRREALAKLLLRLQGLLLGLRGPIENDHQLDASLAAYVAFLYGEAREKLYVLTKERPADLPFCIPIPPNVGCRPAPSKRWMMHYRGDHRRG